MGRINSRSKGQRGEKKAIEFFHEWTGMDFKRSPASGGLRGHIMDYTVGDIICVEKNYIFPFAVEVKSYEAINFAQMIYEVESIVFDYWVQCTDDAQRAEKFPILLMRYNGLPANFFFVAFDLKDYRLLKENGISANKRKMLVKIPGKGSILITNTDEVLAWDWRKVEKILQKKLRKRWAKNQ